MRNRYLLGVDLGTTTVVAVLVNYDKSVISIKSMLNLQYPEFGLDSVARIQNGMDPDSVKKLQQGAISTVNALVDDFKREFKFDYDDIEIAAIAGNTVMEMAMSGYPLASLAKPPYRPSPNLSFPSRTGSLPCFNLKNGELFVFPILDGFVGGDAVSSIYYLDMAKKDKPVFLADFGTNVEIVIGNRHKIFTASAPAGPAFEGGNIKFGMTASAGAVSDISLKNGVFEFKTIKDAKPKGICGSGLMSLIYGLLNEGIIDKSGRILPPDLIDSESYSVVDTNNGEQEVVVYFDGNINIRFFQEDVRQFQLAKSAVKSVSKILLEKFKISDNDDFDIYLSGAFGSHIKPGLIDLIDIFPFKGKKINFINNSSLLGCQKYITSQPAEREKDLNGIIEISKNFPLSGSKLFEKYFIRNMSFLP